MILNEECPRCQDVDYILVYDNWDVDHWFCLNCGHTKKEKRKEKYRRMIIED